MENVEILSTSTEVPASSIAEMDASIKEIEENAEITSGLSEAAAVDALKGKEAVTSVREIAEDNALRTAELDQVVETLTLQTTALGDEVGAFKA